MVRFECVAKALLPQNCQPVNEGENCKYSAAVPRRADRVSLGRVLAVLFMLPYSEETKHCYLRNGIKIAKTYIKIDIQSN